MLRKSIAALALTLGGVAGSASAQTIIPANTSITTNTVWGGAANPSPIILQGATFVEKGPGATDPVPTLTILPGTIVRGQPRTAAVQSGSTVGTPGVLVVTKTGRIVANGSASQPIIFTTAATDNNDDGIADDADSNGFKDTWEAGDTFLDDTPTTAPLAPLDKAGRANVSLWGGLVILGSAPTNDADKLSPAAPYGTGIIEGFTVPGFPAADLTYGGTNPHDNSGILRYISVRHAGDEIGNSNELNGISLGGVGDGTTFEYVEIYCNFDDGIEWFGGTVNGRYLHVAFAGDDMYDVDEGYTGLNQFLFGIMPYFASNVTAGSPPVPVEYGCCSGDKAGEMDGDNYRPDQAAQNNNVNTRISINGSAVDPTPWPLSASNWYNVTAIGSTPPAPEVPATNAASTNRGWQFRNGFAGNVWNSIILNTGAETGIELDTSTTSGPPGFNAIDNANNGLISLVCSTLAGGAALAAQETTVVNNGNALNLKLGGTAAGANVVNNAGFAGLIKSDQTFALTGNAAGKLAASLKPAGPINPRPAAGFVGVGGCVGPAGFALNGGATYRGAFSSSAPTLWTTGWTALNLGGLLAN